MSEMAKRGVLVQQQHLQWYQQVSAAQRQQWQQVLQQQFRQAPALDLQPWYVEQREWQVVEAGLLQRQRLWSLILQDLYGPRQLVRDGLVPADALAACGAYLLPMVQQSAAALDWLVLYSATVIRRLDGSFCVVADHGGPPQGLGRVVEQRLALNQLASEWRGPWPRRQLAVFFRRLLQRMQRQPQGICALLTEGARNSQYSEHARLANYLDIALVRGSDLLYREGQLCLKTLSGLQPLQSVLRFVDAAATDPLEFSDSAQGCAGFVASLRQQQFLCINPPGAELIDSGVLQPYLPALAQQLLGESLALAQLETGWCADTTPPDVCVLQRLQDGQRRAPSSAEYASWQALAQSQPSEYVWSEFPQAQCLPYLTEQGALAELPAAMRLYALSAASSSTGAAAKSNNSAVLPGGLVGLGSLLDFIQQPTKVPVCKDLWVQTEQIDSQSLLSATSELTLSRFAGLVSSRLADHLFWLGRYHERLNHIVRALRAALHLHLQQTPSAGFSVEVDALLRFALHANGAALGTWRADQPLPLPAVVDWLFSERDGLLSIMQSLWYNASSARDYFAFDSTLVLERLQQLIGSWSALQQVQRQTPNVPQLMQLLDEIIFCQHAFYGLNHETMSRTPAMRMLDLGQHIERALQTAGLLQHTLVSPGHAPSVLLQETVLKLADTLMTYRRRYRSLLHPLAVIDLLLFDESTPRSVGYQCQRIQHQCGQLPQLVTGTGLSGEQRLALELVSLLQLAEPASLVDSSQQATPALGLLLGQLQHRLRLLSDHLSQSYFHHSLPGGTWQRI